MNILNNFIKSEEKIMQIIENLKTDEKVAQALSNKEIVKAIYVPNRIVNFIVK